MEIKAIESWKENYYDIWMRKDDGQWISSDSGIAENLGLTYEEYTKFIIQNGGFKFMDYYFFRTKEECQSFIEKIIEPRLIMEKLIK